MKPTCLFIIAAVLAVMVPAIVKAQTPDIPSKSPGLPSKSQPLASPQAALASPQQQQSFVPQYEQPAVVLQAVPRVYAIQRQVVLAAPVAYQTVQAAPVAFASVAYAQTGCVAQQAVVQQSLVQHSAVVNHGLQSAQVNHGLVGAAAGVGRQPKKIKTKQVTRVKRGLFGRG